MTLPQAKTVLVVDDEPSVLAFLAALLRLQGLNVIEAAGGPDAIESTCNFNNPIDLLITDIRMHPMDGVELAAEMRKRKPDIPVLFISGYAPDNEIVTQAVLKIKTDYLQKPFVNTVFAVKVRELLAA